MEIAVSLLIQFINGLYELEMMDLVDFDRSGGNFRVKVLKDGSVVGKHIDFVFTMKINE